MALVAPHHECLRIRITIPATTLEFRIKLIVRAQLVFQCFLNISYDFQRHLELLLVLVFVEEVGLSEG